MFIPAVSTPPTTHMSKRFNKNNSVKFQLVHRSHQDARYHDSDASASVLVPIVDKNQKRKELRTQHAEDLEADVAGQLGKDEGKAANYGITFDDSKYDYLQHLKPIGSSDGVFISRKAPEVNPKEKNKKLAALLGGDDLLPSSEEVKYDYQTQLDIPDEIKGFKPDLNPDLREVLVALEDENYLDQNQDIDEIDVFDELLGGDGKKKEITLREYDQNAGNENYYNDGYEDEDWDYDNFDDQEYECDGTEQGAEPSSDFNWEKDFARYKNTKGRIVDEFDSDNEFEDDAEEEEEDEEDEDDFVGDLPNIGEKGLKSSKSSKKNAKRKKGATTDTSSYSMSSSALCRTEQMTIIDDKFDVLKEQYEAIDDDDKEEYQPFDLANERDDFMDMVDDFLDNYQLEKRGRRVVKKNDEMERYRNAAMSVTKDNSRVKNRNIAKNGDPLADKLDKLRI